MKTLDRSVFRPIPSFTYGLSSLFATTFLLVYLFACGAAWGEGSRDLIENGGNRPWLEYQDGESNVKTQ